MLTELDYVGVLTIEWFQDGPRLLANEMAPRVHNSGHWTIEGAMTSQFENHVRAVCGLPLGRCDAVGYSAMYNFIGAVPPAAEVLANPDAKLHVYGKSPRPAGRSGTSRCGPAARRNWRRSCRSGTSSSCEVNVNPRAERQQILAGAMTQPPGEG